jgi:hypothetical protein
MLTHVISEQTRSLIKTREKLEKEYIEKLLDIYRDDYEACARQVQTGGLPEEMRRMYCSSHSLRMALCRLFAWSIPNREALEAIASCGPIIEIGAGSGYWAHLLRSRYKVNILAYDRKPLTRGTNWYHRGAKPWTGVLRGRPVKAKKYPNRALMMSWPPYNTSMATECLKHYTGNTVIYIGESWGGCTGDSEFHDLLSEQFEIKHDVTIPQWDGVNDYLEIRVRKDVPS